MKLYRYLILGSFLAFSCGSTVSSDLQRHGSDGNLSGAWPPIGLRYGTDGASARLREVGARAVADGWVPAGKLHEGFLASVSTSQWIENIPSDRCLLLMATVSSGVTSAQVKLFAMGDQLMGESSFEGDLALLSTCPTDLSRPRRQTAYGVLQILDGAGLFKAQLFMARTANMRKAASQVGKLRQTLNISSDALEQRAGARHSQFADFRDAMERRQFKMIHGPIALRATPGTPVHVPLSLRAAHCYTVVGFGTVDGKATGLRLNVMTGDGVSLGTDDSLSGRTAVQFCARAPEGVFAVVESPGASDIIYGVFEASLSTVGGKSSKWFGTTGTKAAPLSIDKGFVQDWEARLLMGYGSPEVIQAAFLSPAEVSSKRITVTGPGCTRFFLVGDPSQGQPMRDFRLRVVEQHHGVLNEHAWADSFGALHVCRAASTAVEVQLTAGSAGGNFYLWKSTRGLNLNWAPVLNVHDSGHAELTTRALQSIEDDSQRGWDLHSQRAFAEAQVSYEFTRPETRACVRVHTFSTEKHDAKLLRQQVSVARSVALGNDLLDCGKRGTAYALDIINPKKAPVLVVVMVK